MHKLWFALLMVVVVASCSAQLYPGGHLSTDKGGAIETELKACVFAKMDDYANGKGNFLPASDVSLRYCEPIVSRWKEQCVKEQTTCKSKITLFCKDNTVTSTCNRKFEIQTESLDVAWQESHPTIHINKPKAYARPVDTSPKHDPRMDHAIENTATGKLVGLPRLDVPLFIKKDTFACRSSATLLNPNRENLLLIGSCVIVPDRLQVSVITPTETEELLRGNYFHIVQVVWHAAAVSDGSTHTAWVAFSDLEN